jgi:hypothetical protein
MKAIIPNDPGWAGSPPMMFETARARPVRGAGEERAQAPGAATARDAATATTMVSGFLMLSRSRRFRSKPHPSQAGALGIVNGARNLRDYFLSCKQLHTRRIVSHNRV